MIVSETGNDSDVQGNYRFACSFALR